MSLRPLIKLSSSPRSSAFMTAFILGAAIAIIGSIVWRLSDPVESEIISDPKLINKTIGGVQFQIPGNMFRYRAQRKKNDPERVDLFFQWPSMEGYTKFNAHIFEEGNAQNLIFMSISMQTDGMAPEDRLKSIYKRFFGAPTYAPLGLVGKRFLDGSGYDGEDLFYQDGVEKPFIARCLREDAGDSMPMCLREVKVGPKTHIVYAFRRAYLKEWETMDSTILESFMKVK